MSYYSNLILGDLPQAYYRLGETSGTAISDSSGNGYTATKSGTVTYSQAGAISGDADTSMLFDGSSGYITAPAGLKTDGWSALTVEFWLYLSNNAFAGYNRIIGNDNNPSTSHVGWVITVAPSSDGGAGYFYLGNGTTYAVTNIGIGVLSASYWYHFICTYDGAHITSYVNGGSAGANAALTGTIGTATNPITIAKAPGSASGYFPGRLDEIAIYNYILTPNEMTRHYLTGLYGRTQLNQFPTITRRNGTLPTTKRRGA